MKRQAFLLYLAVAGATACSGCATIVGESNRPVSIRSDPNGVAVTVFDKNGETVYSGRTPTTVRLKAGDGWFKGQDYTVEFQKAGYQTRQVDMRRGVSGWYVVGNVFLGGLIGWLVVDPLTGAMWIYEDLSVELEPRPQPAVPPPG
jgi:hypothetical protein